MIIVLTPEGTHPREQAHIHALFAHGLPLCHIRKYGWDELTMGRYIEGFEPRYRDRLVLHTHPHRAKEWGISRLHFPEKARRGQQHLGYVDSHTCSTSVHSMADFNGLDSYWAYAFLSPVFPSISKPGYGHSSAVLHSLGQRRQTATKLIGLGGIGPANYSRVYREGADGIALMGSIWQSEHPLHTFLACTEKDPSYAV